MRFKPALNAVFGIITEIFYVLVIMLAAFFICWALYFKP